MFGFSRKLQVRPFNLSAIYVRLVTEISIWYMQGFEIIWQPLVVSPALSPEPNLFADFSLSHALAGMCESDEWQTLIHNLQTDLNTAMSSMIQVSWPTIDYPHYRSG